MQAAEELIPLEAYAKYTSLTSFRNCLVLAKSGFPPQYQEKHLKSEDCLNLKAKTGL